MKHELTAKRLQLALSNANMKAQELSNLSGVKKASISQYVNGLHIPSNINAKKMGDILNVNPLWLMGFDVLMECNPYEDDSILLFDAELDEALNIIEASGYFWNYSPSSDNDIIIKDNSSKTISCIPDYELVSKYEYMKKKGTITAEFLVSNPFILCPEEQIHIEKYRSLDDSGKNHIDYELDREIARVAELNTQKTYNRKNTILPMDKRIKISRHNLPKTPEELEKLYPPAKQRNNESDTG